jgi:hypothetical protein
VQYPPNNVSSHEFESVRCITSELLLQPGYSKLDYNSLFILLLLYVFSGLLLLSSFSGCCYFLRSVGVVYWPKLIVGVVYWPKLLVYSAIFACPCSILIHNLIISCTCFQTITVASNMNPLQYSERSLLGDASGVATRGGVRLHYGPFCKAFCEYKV